MSLREQLARRLGEIRVFVDKRTGSKEAIDEQQADEVLRQMEWAQVRGIKIGLVSQSLREGMVVGSPSGAEELARIAAVHPLTLAPPGWQP